MTGPDGSRPPVIDRRNPARPVEIVGCVAAATTADVTEAVDAAASAQRHWAATPLAARTAAVVAASDAVIARRDELAELLARELGKPLADSAGEIGFARGLVGHCAATAPAALADEVVDVGDGRLELTTLPYGVVGAITPWNAPVTLAAMKFAPALLAGNAVVTKPSPLAPLTVTAVLEELAAHLPAGLVGVVNGGVDVGRALVADPRIAKVAFTGGGEAARHLQRDLADRLVPSVLELGGNDAAIVCADAVLDDAAVERLVHGAFLTAGQVCMAAKRIYVDRSRYDELVERYVAVAARALVLGDPLDPTVTVGPLVSEAQCARVATLVGDARRRGATVVELGTVPDPELVAGGWFLRPTLVLGLDDDAPLVATEQFGPTVPIIAVDGDDDAVARANASELGLAASVWSGDEEHAFALARRIEAGTVFIGTHNRSGMTFRSPFGGVKQSGWGRELGDDAVRAYVQQRAIHRPAALGSGRDYPGQAA